MATARLFGLAKASFFTTTAASLHVAAGLAIGPFLAHDAAPRVEERKPVRVSLLRPAAPPPVPEAPATADPVEKSAPPKPKKRPAPPPEIETPPPQAETPPPELTEAAAPAEASVLAVPKPPSEPVLPAATPEPSRPSIEQPHVDLRGLAKAYGRSLYAALNARKPYPLAARRMEQSGVVYISLTVDGEGNILASEVKRSSGVASLDEAALDLVRSATELPVPPAELGWSTRRVTVPLRYVLN